MLTLPKAQIVFVDTPGIHKSDTLLNKRMMDSVRSSVDADVVLFVVDALSTFHEEDAQAVDLVKKVKSPALLVLNKVDHLKDKTKVLKMIERYQALHEFADYIPVSAMKADGLDTLQKQIIDRLPEGPALFPEEHLTDQPERFLAAEILREQVLRNTNQEVPHATAVMIETWEVKGDLVRIAATIFVRQRPRPENHHHQASPAPESKESERSHAAKWRRC